MAKAPQMLLAAYKSGNNNTSSQHPMHSEGMKCSSGTHIEVTAGSRAHSHSHNPGQSSLTLSQSWSTLRHRPGGQEGLLPLGLNASLLAQGACKRCLTCKPHLPVEWVTAGSIRGSNRASGHPWVKGTDAPGCQLKSTQHESTGAVHVSSLRPEPP